MQPLKVERRDDGGLAIRWDDGHVSQHAPLPLRRACRCALCVDEWSGAPRAAAPPIPDDVKILTVRPVGRYGLQFDWSDGHSTGIYTFDRLREACGCDACAPR